MLKKEHKIITGIMIVFIIYASVFINKMGIGVEGEKYHVLMDDAMISMTYAKNFARGKGLVWNESGEKVEGITNLMWTAYMAVPHLLKIDAKKTALFIQISALIFLAFNIFIVYRLSGLILQDKIFAALTALWTGFYFPLNSWSLMGMEVSVITLILSVISLLVIKSLKNNSFDPKIYILAGLLTFIRIDQFFLLAFLTLFMSLYDKSRIKKHLLWGAGIFAAAFIIQTGFRIIYYGEILPNTYYLKMTGYPVFWRIMRGIAVVAENSYYFGWPLIAVAVFGYLSNRSKEMNFVMLIFIAHIAYSIYVGGDITEHLGGANRFYSPAMTYLFLMTAAGIKLMAEKFTKTRKYFLTGLFALIVLLNSNCFHGLKSLKEFFLIEPFGAEKSLLKYQIKRALQINNLAEPGAEVNTVTAGIISYYTDCELHDMLGKNDKYIAGLEMKKPPAEYNFFKKALFFAPGHLKYDYKYSIIKRKPDIIAGLWGDTKSISGFINRNYLKISYGTYVLKKSGKINRENLNKYKITGENRR